MNQAAYDAVELAWLLAVKTRALCPFTQDSAVGLTGYYSPDWYRERGVVYLVNFATPLTASDIQELRQVGAFVNRSFVIVMAALLEAHGVVPYGTDPDRSLDGGDHVQLTKWLRNRFAHGEWEYDSGKPLHVETRELLAKLFPEATKEKSGFEMAIDRILEPLKEGVLAYIRAIS